MFLYCNVLSVTHTFPLAGKLIISYINLKPENDLNAAKQLTKIEIFFIELF